MKCLVILFLVLGCAFSASIDRYYTVYRIRRSPYSPVPYQGYDSHDRLHASDSHLAANQMKGADYLNAGQASHVSQSKHSGSESSKSSKMKSGSNFAAGNQQLSAGQFGSMNAGQFGYNGYGGGYNGYNQGLGGFGGFGGVGGASGVGIQSAGLSTLNAGGIDSSSGFVTGSSNSELEQSESNKDYNSETFDASQASGINAGSQFQGSSLTAGQTNLDREAATSGFGGYRFPRAAPLGFSTVGISKDRLSASSSALAANAAKGASEFEAGAAKHTSSSKSSSSESNKASKIKTGSNFAAGNQQLASGAFGQSNLNSQKYGMTEGVGGFGGYGGYGGYNVGLDKVAANSQFGQNYGTSGGYVAGSSNTEIEQSESNKRAESETHEASEVSGIKGASQFAQTGMSANNQNLDHSRDEYAAQTGIPLYRGGSFVSDVSRDRLADSSITSGLMKGSNVFSGGHASKVSSAKSSASEHNQASKIKSASNFAQGGHNLQAQEFGGYNNKHSNLGLNVGGFGLGGLITTPQIGVNLGSSDVSAAHGQALSSSSGFAQGSSALEAEQSVSDKHSESESHSASEGGFATGANEFEAQGMSASKHNRDRESEKVDILDGHLGGF